jgi:HEPN domain-containing protein
MTGCKSGRQGKKKGKKGEGKRHANVFWRQQATQASVKGIYREFMKSYDSRSYIEGV